MKGQYLNITPWLLEPLQPPLVKAEAIAGPFLQEQLLQPVPRRVTIAARLILRVLIQEQGAVVVLEKPVAPLLVLAASILYATTT